MANPYDRGATLPSPNLNRLVHFAAVVETGSFTRAASRLGVTKAVVSQQVARLEGEVGTTLLIRSTRRVAPTEAGRALHARCVAILGEAEAAFGELAQAAGQPSGILALTAPQDYGVAMVVPVAAAFGRLHPQCRVRLHLSDDHADLLSGEWDLAIRLGDLDDSTLQTRRIGGFRQLLVGAPEFARRLTDDAPDALAALPFVANAALSEPLLWRFSRERAERRIRWPGAAMTLGPTPAVLAAVRAGVGVSVLPDFLVRDDLATGRLAEILPEWRLAAGGIHALFPAARFRPSRVAAFVEMLVAAERARPQSRD